MLFGLLSLISLILAIYGLHMVIGKCKEYMYTKHWSCMAHLYSLTMPPGVMPGSFTHKLKFCFMKWIAGMGWNCTTQCEWSKEPASTVCVKRNAHLIPDFLSSPWGGGGGPKIHMVNNVLFVHVVQFQLKRSKTNLLSIYFKMLWMEVTWFALIFMEICENCNFCFETCFHAC